MFMQFISNSNAESLRHQNDISEIKDSIQGILRGTPPKPPDDDLVQTLFPDRRKQTRRTSMFFGSPYNDRAD